MEAVQEAEKTKSPYTGSNKKNRKKRLGNADALAAAQSPAAVPERAGSVEFKPGTDVLAGTARRRGTLLYQERKGLWSVQFDNIKMSIKEKDLIPVPPIQTAFQHPSITVDLAGDDNTEASPYAGIPANKPVFELRLIGMRCEEAVKQLERQLDLCTVQNFHTFSIIHGKGTGILQQAVQDCLSHYPGVEEFHFAAPEDGGTGKTYVRMY
jgi:DNA mismatch repair protein MutS2